MGLCLSVTSRCCTKTAERRITQTTPHDSPVNLVFYCQRTLRNSIGVKPCGGAKCRWGGLQSATFDKYLAICRKRYEIDAQFLLKSNMKSYALYRTVTLSMTLIDPNRPKPPPIFPFCTAFHILVMGVLETWNLVCRITVASPSLLTTSHPRQGAVGVTWHILEFYTCWNISATATTRNFKFFTRVGYVKY